MSQPRLITTNAIFNKIHTKHAENLAMNSLDVSKQPTVQNIKKNDIIHQVRTQTHAKLTERLSKVSTINLQTQDCRN